jgi:NAD(P)-dependent dehydrogenase (short-subunit alcohol dehydrogenase family)
MDVNLFGTLQLTQAVIPQFKAQGGGAIVMINTMVTRKPMPTQAGYAASKAALASATQHLAQELGPHGIRVNSAFMGWMWGAPVKGYFEAMAAQTGQSVDALKAAVEQQIALGSMPTDADCAKAAIFLASDYACAMTGAALDVNGGEFLPH